MYILTLKTRKEDGAYAVQDKHGDKVLFLFEEEDDADRYAMMLEDDEKYQKEMAVIEVDDVKLTAVATVSAPVEVFILNNDVS